jgi:hypothetical protein
MSGIRSDERSSGAAEAVSAPMRQRPVSAPASEHNTFARALQAAQRRSSDGSRDARSERVAETEALCGQDDGASAACAGGVGVVLSDQARQTRLPAPPPVVGPRALRPLARAAAAARQGSLQEDAMQDSPTTIEWLTAMLPGGRLTLSRAEGGAWTLHCQAEDLEAVRGAAALLADRFEQRALGPLQVHVDCQRDADARWPMHVALRTLSS